MKLFFDLLATVPRPLRILDVGGIENFWKAIGYEPEDGVEITLLNLERVEVSEPGMISVSGDACDLSQYGDDSYDIVFSNSVIEHLFTLENSAKMANEVRRVGKRYFVQTPNKYFPIEPHFHFPFWQFLPESMRASLLMRKKRGHVARSETREKALREVREIRLLTRRELAKLFPDGKIVVERWKGLPKSFMVYGGWQ